MVETKDESTPEDVAIVTAMPSVQPFTLGEALEALEKRVGNAGISPDLRPPRGHDTREGKTKDPDPVLSSKIFRCKFLIDQAIAQSITFGVCEPGNICKEGSEKNLVTGNIVVLRHSGDEYIAMNKSSVGYRSALGIDSPSTRFLVVAAGPNQVAFYSPSEFQFLQVDTNGTLLAAPVAVDVNDRPRVAETFEVQACPKNEGCIRLYNRLYKKFAYLGGSRDSFQVYQVAGLDF